MSIAFKTSLRHVDATCVRGELFIRKTKPPLANTLNYLTFSLNSHTATFDMFPHIINRNSTLLLAVVNNSSYDGSAKALRLFSQSIEIRASDIEATY